MRLALYTFGQFSKPSDDPVNNRFHSLSDAVLNSIERAPGFVARSGYASDPGPASWGKEVYPRFWRDSGDGWAPATLSLWHDLASPYAAAYSGLHARALKQGHKWFQSGDWPPYVMWWVAPHQQPIWREAAAKLEALFDAGPTPAAFNFKQPFDRNGQSTRISDVRPD